MSRTLAQGLIFNPSQGDPIPINGPLQGINNLSDVVNIILTFVYPLAAAILLVIVIWGGIDYLSSGGDPEKVKSGQAKITSGIIGFVLLMLSYLIARVVGFVFQLGEGVF